MTAPWWTNGVSTLYHDDARRIPMPDGSVHCAVMSPPYWSLRDYGLAAWEGGDPECEHVLAKSDADSLYVRATETLFPSGWRQKSGRVPPVNVCPQCGAQRGADGIGLEPTLQEWLSNILAVMREVRRVLRDDGTLWLNLGDAYAGSGKGMNADGTHSPGHKQATNLGTQELSVVRGKRVDRGAGSGRWGMGDAEVAGLPAKNLMFQPHRVALALQCPWLTCRNCEATHHETEYGYWPDGRLICPECLESDAVVVETPGWIVRQTNHWIKTNPMVESAKDRTTSAVEYIFHCTKTNRPLYWGHEDGRVTNHQPKPDFVWEHAETRERRATKPRGWTSQNKMGWARINRWQSRSYFYDAEAVREYEGDGWHGNRFAARAPERHPGENRTVPADRQRPGRNLRNFWLIATQNHKDKHHASFPDRLPELGILAGTSDQGVCAECGSPWIRSVERTGHTNQRKPAHVPGHDQTKTDSTGWQPTTVTTDKWIPTCECGPDTERVPATVLDPFVGRGTTCIVAQRLGRRSVGLDLNPDYLALARRNLEATNLPLGVSP